MNYRQLTRYQCPDRDKNSNKTVNKTTSSKCIKRDEKATVVTGGKLPAHFAYTVYDKDTGQVLDYKKLINHNKKETREWWQQLSANEFEKLMKGAGRNADGTQRVKGSDTFHFIHKKNVPK